ncbi:MAG: PTS sugar transporter subunit IIA [Peptococcaceae bacterium]|nr:PTS sugar transporter subunit IIA [Peptococcaceae bacterium]
MISTDNIYLDLELADYKSVLSTVARLLRDKGYVTKEFEAALLSREELSPTGVPASPIGVALPHTNPQYVIKPCVIIVRLKRPVLFREMGNPSKEVEAKYIFGLAFLDGKEQAPLLSRIISMVIDAEAMEKLEMATTSEEVYNVASAYI